MIACVCKMMVLLRHVCSECQGSRRPVIVLFITLVCITTIVGLGLAKFATQLQKLLRAFVARCTLEREFFNFVVHPGTYTW